MKNITIPILEKFHKEYQKEPSNKIIENAIKNVGLSEFCLDLEVVNNNIDVFNIELPKTKIYNQRESHLCWGYAGLSLINANVAKNLNVNIEDFSLSITYLSFIDKLEKTNTIYEYVIENDNFDLEKELSKGYLQFYTYEGGYFYYFKELVKKYGIVPESVMPEVECIHHPGDLRALLKNKVKKDVWNLIEGKQKKESKTELLKRKEKMLEENYFLLSKCIGEPPLNFVYEYQDKKGTVCTINSTPQEFCQKYLSLNLEDMISIGNVPMYNKEYYKMYQKEYNDSIYQKSVSFLNMPINILKELGVKQLKDGIPVYMGCNMTKMIHEEKGVLDKNLYKYKEVFHTELLAKEEALSLHDISNGHIMLITGVHIENGKPIRWKVQDSYGKDTHKNGYYIMNDNFFDEFVLEVIIDKKYLSMKQLKLLNQKPVLIPLDDPY